jgi:hypothetical protein
MQIQQTISEQSFYNITENIQRNPFKGERIFSTWKVFKKQQLAIEQQTPHQRIFSFQYDIINPGRRCYLLTTLKDFWYEYSRMDCRHFYELIQDKPCHLYFDLEFNIELNPDKNSDKMMSGFIGFVTDALYTQFGVNDIEVVKLDSTTCTKFSKHVLFRSKEFKFQNNIICGYFVKSLIAILEDALRDSNHIHFDLAKLLQIQTKQGLSYFLDVGVYTRNRNFRCWLSSKMGKHQCLEFQTQEPFIFDTFRRTLVCDGEHSRMYPFQWDAYISNTIKSATSHVASYSKQISLYPKKESRLLYLIGEFGLNPPFIRSFIEYPESHSILYIIGGNRYCHNVEREHSSNNVYYIVSLDQDTYHQRCYDPECSKFRSETRKLWNIHDYFDDYPDSLFLEIDSQALIEDGNDAIDDDKEYPDEVFVTIQMPSSC